MMQILLFTIMNQTLGHLFLNLAFILYLVLYLPQLIHNAKRKAFKNMSMLMHLMLLQAYSCDLFYAISRQMPWQYLTVSCFGLTCLLIQHIQWMFFQKDYRKFITWALFCLGWPSILWFSAPIWQYHVQAWVARLFFLIHFLPQILKYHQNNIENNAINLNYLSFSICLSICDLASAWLLHWDFANVLGSFWSLGLKTYLFWLSVNINPKLSFLKTRSAR